MPLYFFNVHGVRPSLDIDGEELPDDKAAWYEATIIAAEIFRDIDGKFQPGHEWALEVTDRERKPIYIIKISATHIK